MFIIFSLVSSFFALEHEVTAKEDELFTIELASNPTTGYMWQFLEPETRSNGTSSIVLFFLPTSFFLGFPTFISDKFIPQKPTEGKGGHMLV